MGGAPVDSFRAMQLFVSVVHNGSLSAAGRQFGLSPASVSRQINALEDSLGARLLNRTSRKLTLTEPGEVYLDHAEQILHQIDRANASVSQLQRVPRGTLRVHSRILVGSMHIVPALPEFLRRYPEIKVDLLMSNNEIDLVERNVDVDIRIGKLADSSLIARKLAVSERVVCVSPDYLAAHPKIKAPADLAAHNCLTYRINMGRTVWRFMDRAGTLAEIPMSGTLCTDFGPALRTAALAGVGIVLMPDWAVRDGHVEFDNGIYAVYQHSRHVSPKVRLFVDFVVDLFRARPA
jgi:DNA-binding transcriptional LysR family regulator